jgi:hypothetical protein
LVEKSNKIEESAFLETPEDIVSGNEAVNGILKRYPDKKYTPMEDVDGGSRRNKKSKKVKKSKRTIKKSKRTIKKSKRTIKK